jgi:hypothetical protein
MLFLQEVWHRLKLPPINLPQASQDLDKSSMEKIVAETL